MHTALGRKNGRTHMLNMTQTTARNNVKHLLCCKRVKATLTRHCMILCKVEHNAIRKDKKVTNYHLEPWAIALRGEKTLLMR